MVYAMNRLIAPLNKDAAVMLRNAAKNVAPLGECGRYHEKCEVERRKAAEEGILRPIKKKRKVTVPMELIDLHLKFFATDDYVPPRRTKRRKNFRTACISPNNSNDEGEFIDLPIPANKTPM